MTANCMGGCGKPVTSEGYVCASCWFPPQEQGQSSSNEIKEQILRAAFVLRFGTRTEQAEALEALSHSVFVLHQ